MSEFTDRKKIEIRDDWLRMRDARIAKSTRLKDLARKYGVTQKAIKDVAYEFNVWTKGDGYDETPGEREARYAEASNDLDDQIESDGNRGCTVMVIVTVFLLAAYFAYVYHREQQLEELCREAPLADVCTSRFR